MPNVVVKESHLTYGGIAYFRAHAEEIELGSIGEKRKPLAKQNYLEVKDRILIPEDNIVEATVVDIDFSKSSKVALNASGSGVVSGVPAKAGVKASFERFKSGDLKLVKFSVSNRNIIKAANQSKDQLDQLIRWGRDARIAHQIFVVMEAKLANEFSRGVDVNISAGVNGLEAKVGGGFSASGKTDVKISKDTCFAYLLLKIEWDEKKKANRTKIVDLNDDQWGLS